MHKKNQFCIVAQGGGMTTAYHAGVIQALRKRFGFKSLSKVVASSGAAAVYTYLVSKQEEEIQPIWEDLVKSKKFAKPWQLPPGKGIMDIDYLVDQIIKIQHPLNQRSLMKSPINLKVGVTNAKTGKSEFFSKNETTDFYELLRASCAVPYFARDKVQLGHSEYYDGTIGSSAGLEQVKEEQNVLIILIRDKPRSYPNLIRKATSWLFIRNETPKLQEAIWNMVDRYDKLPKDIKDFSIGKNVAVIQPSRAMPMLRVDTSLARLNKTIKLGYLDTMHHKGLDTFFSKF